MSGIAEFVVYRYVLNAPNSVNGGWIQEGIVRDLKADQAGEAVAQVADATYPDAKRRVHRWDTTEEFDPTARSLDFQPTPKSAEPEVTA